MISHDEEYRQIETQFRTAEHDRAILAEALQFLLSTPSPFHERAHELIRKLDEVVLKGRPPEEGGRVRP